MSDPNTETVTVHSDPVAINSMADKFRQAMAEVNLAAAPEPSAKPAAKPATAPAATPSPAPTPVVSPAPDTTGTKPAVPKFQQAAAPDNPVQQSTQPAVDDEPLPEAINNATQSVRDNFKIMRSGLKKKEAALKLEINELRSKLEAAAKTPAAPADYEEIKTRAAKAVELEALVKQFDVTRDDRFIARFDQPIAEARETLRSLGNPDTAELLETVLEAPPGKWRDKQAREVAKALDDVERLQFIQEYSSLAKLQKARAEELKKAPDVLSQIQTTRAQEAAEEKARAERALVSLADATLADAARHSPIFAESADNAEHNARVAANRDLVRNFITGALGQEDTARMAVWAVHGIHANEQIGMQQALIQKLQEQLKGLQSASPSVTGSPGGAEPAATRAKGPADVREIAADMGRKFNEMWKGGQG